MDVITLDAQPRELGTAAARRARREEQVPCVLYGPHQEPVHFRVPVLDMRPLIYTTETHRVTLRLEGEEFDCILKNLDFDPVTDQPAHCDFYALTAGEEISITVPVAITGVPVGVTEGGVMSQVLNEIDIRCLPANIPGQVVLDVSDLGIGDSLHVSDIEAEDYVIATDPSRTVVTVTAPTIEPVEEEPEEELLLEGEELGEGVDAEAAEAAGEEEGETPAED